MGEAENSSQPRNRATAQPRNRAISGIAIVTFAPPPGRTKNHQTTLSPNFRFRKMTPTTFGVFFCSQETSLTTLGSFFRSPKPNPTTLAPIFCSPKTLAVTFGGFLAPKKPTSRRLVTFFAPKNRAKGRLEHLF